MIDGRWKLESKALRFHHQKLRQELHSERRDLLLEVQKLKEIRNQLKISLGGIPDAKEKELLPERERERRKIRA